MNSEVDQPRQRLVGLDLARFFAFVGMVIVNFDIVMVHGGIAMYESSFLAQALQGRAAATFVVLAGIGLGLAAAGGDWSRTFTVTLKRAAFLLVVGLLNAQIFEADIIHYYAVYFLIGALLVRASEAMLWIAMFGLVFGFVGLTGAMDYEAGWNWTTLTYNDFWTPQGFIRNLFFNGWHPVVPWLAFLLFGIWLSRLDLGARAVQVRLAISGATMIAVSMLASRRFAALVGGDGSEAAILFTTESVPPMPLYMLAGSGAACLVIGLCLYLAPRLKSAQVFKMVTAAGRQTLTLYIAHIVIGMGVLEALGMIGGQTGSAALLASLLFCVLAIVYATLWSRRFKRGPLESMMRRLAA